MKRQILLSMIFLLLFVICVNSAFADYIGPNPDLRTYTEYTIEQISITGVYVQCVDDTASPARTLGQFCDISGSNAPEGMTPPSVTSCSSFAEANKSVRTQTSCEYNTTIGVNVQKQAGNATAAVAAVCSGTTGADGWCGGNITLTLSGTEPKPKNSLNGGEIVIAGDSQTKRGAQPYTFDVSKEGSPVSNPPVPLFTDEGMIIGTLNYSPKIITHSAGTGLSRRMRPVKQKTEKP